MTITLSSIEKSTRLRSDLRLGLPILLQDGNERAIALAIEASEEMRLQDLLKLKCDSPYLAITTRRAETLNARVYDNSVTRINLPKKISFKWLESTADPSSDLNFPMKGPYKTIRNGNSNIARAAIELCKKSQLLPAALLIPISNCTETNLKKIGILENSVNLILADLKESNILKKVSVASVPLKYMKNSKVHVFKDVAGLSEHYAIEIGDPKRNEPVLVRLHSACFTGDVIGSLKCDCGSQLEAALNQISINKKGLLIYLNQEGRGIGMANKMRAYELQNQGFDTVEANHRLGFEDEERDLKIGADIIKKLGFNAVRLLTNNPKKIKTIKDMGLLIKEHINLKTEPTVENASYLATKALKSGHML